MRNDTYIKKNITLQKFIIFTKKYYIPNLTNG